MTSGTFFWKRPELSRRLFFRHLATAVGGYFLMPGRPLERVASAAASPIGRAKNVVFVLLAGGPSHVDTFDLKEGPWHQNVVGGTKVADLLRPTSYGDVLFPQGLMPTLAEQLEHVVLLRSVRAWALVHSLGQTWVQIGRNPFSALGRIAPHIGSVVSLELTDKQLPLPAFVSLNTNSGPNQGYFEPRNAPFYLSPNGNGLANTQHPDGAAAFERRWNLLQALDGEFKQSQALGERVDEMVDFNRSARQLMYNAEVDRVFRFTAEEKSRYGGTTNNNGTNFGNSCLAARNLLRGKVGTRFIQITLGGWDNHSNIYQPNAGLQAQSRQLDLGLGNLMKDLQADGLLGDTLVVAMGEFGRTVGNPNTQAGRDHFLQQAVLVAGAGIRGKRAIGSTDVEGRNIAEAGWSRNREIRPEDIEATIYSALGIDWTKVLRDDPLGRGFEYVPFSDRDEYGPIHELWG